jgi:serine protease AprX
MVSKTVPDHDHDHSQNRFAALPTALRLGIDSQRSGRGVTIAFLDSGFYPHPDLTQPVNRIIGYKDVTRTRDNLETLKTRVSPESWDWHGTMTSVVAAGNGHLSNGAYRGLASASQVVLVKVGDMGRITEQNIERGLRWVIDNRERYNIRVVSISLGGDEDVSYKTNAVDQAAEEAVKSGLVVVVAAGNSGCSENYKPVPPANSPSVITVGGYDDGNKLDPTGVDLYCSNYGVTADGLVKPEIIAPAMWIAAPILPNTAEYHRAEALSLLAYGPDYLIERLSRPAAAVNHFSIDLWKAAGLPEALRGERRPAIRAAAEAKLQEHKIIATHYQHADGTSFAAPIVASIAAQIIEANPALSPAAIRHILISTADRIPSAPLLRQGYGVINASRAVEAAQRETHSLEEIFFCAPRVKEGRLEFTYHDDASKHVALAGDFNAWSSTSTLFTKQDDGVWRTQIGPLSPGRYRYKLVLNGERWIEDPANTMKEPDEYGGFNSILHVS